MDADRFEALLRTLSTVGSRRRGVMTTLAAAFGLGVLRDPGGIEAHDLSEKCKKKSGKQKKKCLKKAKKHNATHTTDGGPDGGPGGGTGDGGNPEECPGVNLQVDANNCGECGKQCSFPHATAVCNSGSCAVGECEPGYADCDPNAPGCETELGTPEACNFCGDICDTSAQNAVVTCQPGSGGSGCVYTCEFGFEDCAGFCDCPVGQACTPDSTPPGTEGTMTCDDAGPVCVCEP